jgi:hypothetical protein
LVARIAGALVGAGSVGARSIARQVPDALVDVDAAVVDHLETWRTEAKVRADRVAADGVFARVAGALVDVYLLAEKGKVDKNRIGRQSRSSTSGHFTLTDVAD